MNRIRQRIVPISLLAVLYFVAGKLGLTLAFVHPSATAIWPCSGIAISALLLFGFDLWPAILLGAFLVNLTTAGSVATSIGIATGNTLEAIAGTFMLLRFANGTKAMQRTVDIFKFALLGAMTSSTIAATMGASSLLWGGFATEQDFAPIWMTWWLGDAVGIILIVSLVLLWKSKPVLRWRWTYVLEAVGLLACLVFIGLVVFDGYLIPGTKEYPLEYLCIPFLIWAAWRFGQREAAIATLALSATAVWGTLHGLGPFGRESQNESLMLLQAFLGVCAMMTLVLGSEASERRRAEREAKILAVMDRLTGLGNYRKLIDSLETEIKRSERMGRTFTFVLMDLDGLKQINDVHGHPVGNRALCRLANVLQVHSRSMDTAARYGGDEFALILPECGAEL
ncbi:MAG TPA: MASE1 domain-containing protein, partial [Terriglobia bacterium]|nr:MASE1 domain-containing protein [Terriglobia bacterium]